MDPDTLTNIDSYEHIYLASDKPEQAEPTHFDAALSHRRGQSKQTVTIFNGEYLGIRTIRKSQTECFHWLSLSFVDSIPTIRLGLVGKLQVASLIGLALGLCAVIFLTLGDRHPLATAVLFTASIPIVLGVTMPTIQKRREYVFETLHGRSELFRLAGHRVDEKDIMYFMLKLVQLIDINRNNRQLSRQALLCEEMRQHQRLFDEGMFNQAQFRTARCLILGAHDE